MQNNEGLAMNDNFTIQVDVRKKEKDAKDKKTVPYNDGFIVETVLVDCDVSSSPSCDCDGGSSEF